MCSPPGRPDAPRPRSPMGSAGRWSCAPPDRTSGWSGSRKFREKTAKYMALCRQWVITCFILCHTVSTAGSGMMKRVNPFLFFLSAGLMFAALSVLPEAWAQEPAQEDSVYQAWVRHHGTGELYNQNRAYGIATDDSGNVYVTGWSMRDVTGSDYATIKYNSDGNEQWIT
ncbi:MAG TPA: hypothetical protein ENI92_04895, partial [Bacteroidetes bacterium]|nr:hypothetical protein [Bacteroidota bacterium]